MNMIKYLVKLRYIIKQEVKLFEEWNGFTSGNWQRGVDVRSFIQRNYTPYTGNDEFLEPATQNTKDLWAQVMELTKKERENNGVLDMDTEIVSTITSHGPGYLDKDKEKIVGFQTDKPFKRAMMVYGGLRTAEQALKKYGYEMEPKTKDFFVKHRKTHNDGVFDVYNAEMRKCRSNSIITGLPDAYGRGRIIGDYRRAALYGLDYLIADKQNQKDNMTSIMTEEIIRDREELSAQIKALKDLVVMAESYGIDIRKPAKDVKEAIQFTYFAYLGAIKEQNGAAMSLGRVSTFLDIYAERDLKNNVYTEEEIQEFVDHFIMKLRLVKFARTPEYNNLFSGDPVWVTESIGGMGIDGRPLVTKMSFRFLHTLTNLGPAPEPNLTVLWSVNYPQPFKEFCAKLSILSSSIQYENDDLMRIEMGDDYGIACCVSPMKIGKEMQFFGARANLAKALLYAINGGVDEVSKKQVGPKYRPVTSEYLDYDEVYERYIDMLEWLAGVYVNTLNIIHYMHDKYSYEQLQLAFHDKKVKRYFATGMAGLSVVADSLSAIKHAKVKVIRDEDGLAVNYEIEGDYPKYGNDDDRVDSIAANLVSTFMNMIRKHHTYRNSLPTMSILTITSNVVYGKATGNTPDGRKANEAFAPGANPMHQRDSKGAIASLSSVSKIPFADSRDGISNTFSIVPGALGKDDEVFIGELDLDMDLDLDEGKAFSSNESCSASDSACKAPTLQNIKPTK